jgi:starch phosphorylase
MAHLATVGSHAINGVAALHSELLKDSVLKDFYELWPERFSNKTNGVTPRRFLALANPGLRELLDDTIGDGWLTDLYQLRGLEAYADDTAFHGQWRAVKRANKARLADFVRSTAGVGLNPDWLFDIQVKRIHEYKRQHLNVLNIVTQYRRLKQNSDLQIPPRAFIFGGKAAPGYFMAKRIIKLINAVGETVNADNFFLFGLSVEEVERIKRDGYRPSDYIDGNSELAAVLDLIAGGAFSDGDTEVFRPLVDNLRYDDPFLVLADYAAYVSCQ